MKLFSKIFSKFHKVRFGEVYSYFESNGFLENLSKSNYKFSVKKLKRVIAMNPVILQLWVFNPEILEIEGVGPKVTELIQHMIRHYYWDNNINEPRVNKVNMWE